MDNELKPYGEYKKVNLLWLDNVPLHWSVLRGKQLFNSKKQLNKNNECNNILSLTLRGVVNNSYDNPEGLVPKDYGTYQIFEKDDLVFKLIDLENYRTSRVGIVHEKGIMSPAYIRLTKQTDLNIRYFYHQYFDLYLRGIYNQLGAGVRSTLSSTDLINLCIVVPPRDEQDQIVKYLDFQIAKINKFIKTKKKLIEALKEQKQAVINEAVTKGINLNVKMKPSGIEWLGDIPEQWDVRRCKFLYCEVDERSQYGEETHLSMSQKYGLIPNEELGERRLLSENYIGAKVCRKDDLVLNRLKAHLGVFALSPQLGVVSPDYTVLRHNELIHPKFGEYALKCQACRGELCKRVKGIVMGFWRLYTNDFYNIVLPLPTYEEQENIVDFIEEKFNSIDNVISKAQQEIELITEYRVTLISDVVTGKVDVRHIEIDDIIEEDTEIDETKDEIIESEEDINIGESEE